MAEHADRWHNLTRDPIWNRSNPWIVNAFRSLGHENWPEHMLGWLLDVFEPLAFELANGYKHTGIGPFAEDYYNMYLDVRSRRVREMWQGDLALWSGVRNM